jgi:hypothetical protein
LNRAFSRALHFLIEMMWRSVPRGVQTTVTRLPGDPRGKIPGVAWRIRDAGLLSCAAVGREPMNERFGLAGRTVIITVNVDGGKTMH